MKIWTSQLSDKTFCSMDSCGNDNLSIRRLEWICIAFRALYRSNFDAMI